MTDFNEYFTHMIIEMQKEAFDNPVQPSLPLMASYFYSTSGGVIYHVNILRVLLLLLLSN